MDELKSILSAVAPTIATALGGPLAGGAVKYLSDRFLGNGTTDPVEIAQAIGGADPETLVKLKQIDKDYAVKMRELDIDLDKLHQQDRDSARGLMSSLAEAGSRAQWAAPLVSLVVTVGFFIVVYAILQGRVPDGQSQIAFMLLGTLAAGFTQVLNFWLGSSKGSKDKTQHLAEMKK